MEAKIHVFKSNGSHWGFNPGSYGIFALSQDVAKVIGLLARNYPVDKIASLARLSLDDVVQVAKWYDALPLVCEKDDDFTTLRKLVVLTSTHCNLQCAYCYANGGNYRNAPAQMDKATAETCLDYFTSVSGYRQINGISFFGGEPLLNLDAIEAICRKAKDLYDKGVLRKTPRFAVTTNGTVVSDRVIRILNEYKVAVCVSIDGPTKLHDFLRPYKDGKGSLKKVLGTIGILKRNCPECRFFYDATFTQMHVELGYTMQSLREEIANLTGIHDGVVVPVIEFWKSKGTHKWGWNSKGDVYHMLMSDVENLWGQYSRGKLFVDQVVSQFLVQFVGRKVLKMCELGSSIFAISPEGIIYPCQILTGRKEFALGSIFSSTPLNESTSYKKFTEENSFLTKQSNDCLNCIARNFCLGCPARWFVENGSMKPPKGFCSKSRRYVRECLIKLVQVREDPEKWAKFMNALKRNQEAVC